MDLGPWATGPIYLCVSSSTGIWHHCKFSFFVLCYICVCVMQLLKCMYFKLKVCSSSSSIFFLSNLFTYAVNGGPDSIFLSSCSWCYSAISVHYCVASWLKVVLLSLSCYQYWGERKATVVPQSGSNFWTRDQWLRDLQLHNWPSVTVALGLVLSAVKNGS